MWIVAASLSAVFAGLTAMLSKCGVKQANATVASAIRTSRLSGYRFFTFLLQIYVF